MSNNQIYPLIQSTLTIALLLSAGLSTASTLPRRLSSSCSVSVSSAIGEGKLKFSSLLVDLFNLSLFLASL